MEKMDLSYVASEYIKWYSRSGKWVGSFLKKKQSLHWPYSAVIARLPQRNKNWRSHEICEIHSNSVGRSLNLETVQMSFSRWLLTQTVVCPRHGIRRHAQRFGRIAEALCREMPDSKGYLLHDSIDIKVSNWQNYKSGNVLVVSGLRRRRVGGGWSI